MKHTQIERWLREPPDQTKLQLETILPHSGYSWTGWPGARYDLQTVWQLLIWNIDDRVVLLVDTLLCEYYVKPPHLTDYV
jgi:hypothetical protein